MKKPAVLTTALAALALVGGLAAPASAVVETTTIRLGELERGADATVPHLEGKTLVDGDLRITFSAGQVRFLGVSGDDYVVATSTADGTSKRKVLRVTPADERTVIFRGAPVWALTLSGDGLDILRVRTLAQEEQTRVTVRSASDGSVVATRDFRGYASVLDAEDGRAVLGSWEPNRAFRWNWQSDNTRRLADDVGYRADIGTDRLAVFTKNPHLGGCSVVTTISDPDTPVWESCRQAVWGFAPGGTRMATIHKLTDGLGPGQVQLRKSGGKLLARYEAYVFSDVLWESDTSLLLETHSKKRVGLVRCVVADCELASDLRTSQLPRAAR